jgi:8-oxo-dGTP diphosphatase
MIPVAVAVIVEDRHILMSKYLQGGEQGCWAFPGGKVDRGESLREGVIREVLEETNLIVTDTLLLDVLEARLPHGDFLQIFYHCRTKGSLITTEPFKHSEWEWFPLNDLPDPLAFGCAHFKRKWVPEFLR